MKKVVAVSCGLLLVAAALYAQAAPVKVLDQKSLDRFLADYPKMARDGEDAGLGMEETAQGGGAEGAMAPPAPGQIAETMRNTLKALKQNPEAKRILAAHGWDGSFWDILFAVTASLGIVSMEEGFEGQPIPAQVQPYLDEMRSVAHQSDIALVKKNREKIEAALAEGDE